MDDVAPQARRRLTWAFRRRLCHYKTLKDAYRVTVWHSPAKVLDGVSGVSLGSYYSAAIKSDGSLWTWGDDRYGKLGDGEAEERHSPNCIFADGVWLTKESIAGAVVTLEKASSTYTGKSQRGAVKSVVLGGKTLEAGADYVVSAVPGVNVGSYRVTVTGQGNYAESATATFTIAKAASSVRLAAQTRTYAGKALAYTGKVTRSGSSGKVTYSYYKDKSCKRQVKPAAVKAAGTYYVKASLAADENHRAATSAAAKLTITKAANPMSVSGKTATVGYSKKRARTVKASAAYGFKKKAAGAVTYSRVASGSSKWLPKVDSSTGAITVKAGAPKGKVQSVKVKLTAKGDANRKSATKTATVKVKVK